MVAAQPATAAFARLIATTTWDDVAGQVHEAKRSLLNFFATALGSAHDPVLNAGLRVIAPFSGKPAATVIGRAERLDMLGAAFLNAIAANLLDYDDTHLATVIHPAAPVAAPALALAEARSLSGRDVLLAFILGVEVECRIGNAVSPGHYARGWHITASCGVFGAAAAAARLIGLDEARIAHALGIAASQSGSLVENLPTAAKNVGVGNAARNGILSALFAEAGYDSAPLAVEGPLGWARAMGDVPDMAALTDGLGQSWEIAKNTYKPYPSGIVFHAVIDACLALRDKLPGGAADVVDVLVEGSALLLARGDRIVRNERDARVSIHHAVACGLMLGRAGPEEFATPMVIDPAMVAMRAHVRAQLDSSMADGAARVTVTMRSGATITETVLHARGSLQEPLSDAELEAKLLECARQGGRNCDPDRLIAAVWSLDGAETIGPLLRLACPS